MFISVCVNIVLAIMLIICLVALACINHIHEDARRETSRKHKEELWRSWQKGHEEGWNSGLAEPACVSAAYYRIFTNPSSEENDD